MSIRKKEQRGEGEPCSLTGFKIIRGVIGAAQQPSVKLESLGSPEVVVLCEEQARLWANKGELALLS